MASEPTSRVAAYERLTRLPTFHPTAIKLMTLSTESDSALADFEEVFKADLTLTADLLLTANSAAFGLRSRVDTIRHALTLLGLERVRSLAFNIMWGAYRARGGRARAQTGARTGNARRQWSLRRYHGDITVLVCTRTVHTVLIFKLREWRETNSGSPREMSRKANTR